MDKESLRLFYLGEFMEGKRHQKLWNEIDSIWKDRVVTSAVDASYRDCQENSIKIDR